MTSLYNINDDPSPLILNKTQEYEGLGCVSNGTLHTICAVGYIPPFHKIMHGTHILGKIFDQDNSHEKEGRPRSVFDFCFPRDCQSRGCCLAGYMTPLSAFACIIMQIIGKAHNWLLYWLGTCKVQSYPNFLTHEYLVFSDPIAFSSSWSWRVIPIVISNASAQGGGERESAKIRKSTFAFLQCAFPSLLYPLGFFSCLPNWIVAGPSGLSLGKN